MTYDLAEIEKENNREVNCYWLHRTPIIQYWQ